MGRRSRAPPSDSSDESSGGGGYSDYGSLYTSSHRSHHKRPLDTTPCPSVSSKLRPRTNRRSIVYQDMDSEIEDFLESDDEDERETEDDKGSLENLPIVLDNTVEKFLARRIRKCPLNTAVPEPDTARDKVGADSGLPSTAAEKGDATNGTLVPSAGSLSDLSPSLGSQDRETSASGEAPTERPSEGTQEKASATVSEEIRSSNFQEEQPSEGAVEYEYLVKYHHLSYLHCEWLSEESILASIATDRPLRTRFNNFFRKIEAGIEIPEAELVNAVPERIVDCSDPFRALYPTKAADVARNDWTMYCLKIVDALVCFSRDHRRYGIPFLRPVDEEKDGAPGYYDVVKAPMDFVTVQTKLYLRRYESPQEFWADVKRIFSNCLQYNSPRTEISISCRLLEALFDKLYHEWARISREKKEDLDSHMSSVSEDLPYVPTNSPDLTAERAIQHVSFLKQLQNPDRTVLYLVKWKNRSYTEMSWELTADIPDKMKIAQYHRHVRVPEYVVGTKGPGFWELDLQRRMLQETLLHCKAAREYLYGNMAVPIQSLPALSSAGTPHITKERWSYNSGHVREHSARHQMYPRMFPSGVGVGGAGLAMTTNANVAADNEQQRQQAMMMRRNALMVGSSMVGHAGVGSSPSHLGQASGLGGAVPGGNYGTTAVGAAATLVPSAFLDQHHHSSQQQQHHLFPQSGASYASPDSLFATQASLAAAFAARFGRFVPPNGMATAARSLSTGVNEGHLGSNSSQFVGGMPSQLNLVCSSQSNAPTSTTGGMTAAGLHGGVPLESAASVNSASTTGSSTASFSQFPPPHLFPSVFGHHHSPQQPLQHHHASSHQSGLPPPANVSREAMAAAAARHFLTPGATMMHMPHTLSPHQHLVPQVAFPTPASSYRQFVPQSSSSAASSQQSLHHSAHRPPQPSQATAHQQSMIGMTPTDSPAQQPSKPPAASLISAAARVVPPNAGTAIDESEASLSCSLPTAGADPGTALQTDAAVQLPSGSSKTAEMCEGYVSMSDSFVDNCKCLEKRDPMSMGKTFKRISWESHLIDSASLYKHLPASLHQKIVVPSFFMDATEAVHCFCDVVPKEEEAFCEGYTSNPSSTANTSLSTTVPECPSLSVEESCDRESSADVSQLEKTDDSVVSTGPQLDEKSSDDPAGGNISGSDHIADATSSASALHNADTSDVPNRVGDHTGEVVSLNMGSGTGYDKENSRTIGSSSTVILKSDSMAAVASHDQPISGNCSENIPLELSDSNAVNTSVATQESSSISKEDGVVASENHNELLSEKEAEVLESKNDKESTVPAGQPLPQASVIPMTSPVVSVPPVPVAPPVVVDRSRPASFAAQSIYAAQFSRMKMPKPPPPGVSRHYPVSSTYKGNRKLFDYQLDGLNWMLDLWSKGNNGVLADEMGLGKTVQSMAFLWHLYTKERVRGPFLVVAPLSTLDHWKRTAEDWTDLNVVLYYDENGRAGRDALRRAEWYHCMVDVGQPVPLQKMGSLGGANATSNGQTDNVQVNPRIVTTSHYKFQLLLTSYEIFASDAEILVPIPWQFVVVDEAHRLKNRLSKTLQLLRQVACRHTLLLTGTPVQNNTEELWPLLNYIEPVRFCDVDAFKLEFGDLQTNEQVTRLTELLRPHLLRRVKEDVAESIPPLEETIIDVELTILQKAYYKAIFERNKNFLFKNAKKGQQVPSLMNVEMELRKCCNHPFMIYGVEQREYATCKTEAEKFKKLTESSGKLVLLDKLLPKLKAEGHKVLIFSQFQQTLSLIQEFIMYKGWEYERLDGQVKGTERSAAITRFNDPNGTRFIFLLSTRAGGLGINLTSADTVIIFDSDWNPQNDIQATARAHRIGQEREVKVYRLVTARTYEADMFDRASKKLGLNTAVFHRGAFDSKSRLDKLGNQKGEDGALGVSSSAKAPSKEEIEELLKKGAFYLLENNADAAREFQENNIEEILSRNSRLVRYQLTGMRSTFAKTSFKSDKASDLSFDDPDFWQKVLNDSSSRRLLARLNDGSATANEESMEEFMTDLQAAVEGIAAEDDPEPVIEALVQLSNLTTFSAAQREKAEEWLARVNSNLEALHEVTASDGVTVATRGSPRTPSESGGDNALGIATSSSLGHHSGAGSCAAGHQGDDDETASRAASGVSGTSTGLRRSARVSRMEGSSGATGSGYGLSEERLYWMMAVEERDRRRVARRARRSMNEAAAATADEGAGDGDDDADIVASSLRKKRTFQSDASIALGDPSNLDSGAQGNSKADGFSGGTSPVERRSLYHCGNPSEEDAASAAVLNALLSDTSSPLEDDDDDDDSDVRQRLHRRRSTATRRGTGTRAKRRSMASRVGRGGTDSTSVGTFVKSSGTATSRKSKRKSAAAISGVTQPLAFGDDLVLDIVGTAVSQDQQTPDLPSDGTIGLGEPIGRRPQTTPTASRKRRVSAIGSAGVSKLAGGFSSDTSALGDASCDTPAGGFAGSGKKHIRTDSRRLRKELKEPLLGETVGVVSELPILDDGVNGGSATSVGSAIMDSFSSELAQDTLVKADHQTFSVGDPLFPPLDVLSQEDKPQIEEAVTQDATQDA